MPRSEPPAALTHEQRQWLREEVSRRRGERIPIEDDFEATAFPHPPSREIEALLDPDYTVGDFLAVLDRVRS